MGPSGANFLYNFFSFQFMIDLGTNSNYIAFLTKQGNNCIFVERQGLVKLI